jgi:hypothetical protein
MRTWTTALGAMAVAGLLLGCDGGALAPATSETSHTDEADVCVDMPEMDMYCPETTDTADAAHTETADVVEHGHDPSEEHDAVAADHDAVAADHDAVAADHDAPPVDTQGGMAGMDM